jgi:hypothetical protein
VVIFFIVAQFKRTEEIRRRMMLRLRTNNAAVSFNFWRKLPLRSIAIVTLICCFNWVPASAQSSGDEAWYWQLVRSFGKTLYWAAWPTDKYDHMEFEHVEFKPGGADVYVVLYGDSWLEGRLWTEVVTEIRNGQVTDMHFGRYSSNAIIPPGYTVARLSEALDNMNKQLQDQQRQNTAQPRPVEPSLAPHPVSVICISNSTQYAMIYSIPSENIASGTYRPGDTWMYWHDGSGQFTVTFNDGGSRRTVRVQGVTRNSKPASCEENMIYDFISDGEHVDIAPRLR